MARVNSELANDDLRKTEVVNEALSYLTKAGQSIEVKEISDIDISSNKLVGCEDDLIIVTSKEIILPRRKIREIA